MTGNKVNSRRGRRGLRRAVLGESVVCNNLPSYTRPTRFGVCPELNVPSPQCHVEACSCPTWTVERPVRALVTRSPQSQGLEAPDDDDSPGRRRMPQMQPGSRGIRLPPSIVAAQVAAQRPTASPTKGWLRHMRCRCKCRQEISRYSGWLVGRMALAGSPLSPGRSSSSSPSSYSRALSVRTRLRAQTPSPALGAGRRVEAGQKKRRQRREHSRAYTYA